MKVNCEVVAILRFGLFEEAFPRECLFALMKRCFFSDGICCILGTSMDAGT